MLRGSSLLGDSIYSPLAVREGSPSGTADDRPSGRVEAVLCRLSALPFRDRLINVTSDTYPEGPPGEMVRVWSSSSTGQFRSTGGRRCGEATGDPPMLLDVLESELPLGCDPGLNRSSEASKDALLHAPGRTAIGLNRSSEASKDRRVAGRRRSAGGLNRSSEASKDDSIAGASVGTMASIAPLRHRKSSKTA